MNSNRTPVTLRFIIQLLIVLFVLIIGTSIVELSLTMTSFKSVTDGIEIYSHVLNRFGDLSSARTVCKLLIYLANGYMPDYNDKFYYFNQVYSD